MSGPLVLSPVQRERYLRLREVWPLLSLWTHVEDGGVYALLTPRHWTRGEGIDVWIKGRALYLNLDTGRTYDRDSTVPEATSFAARFVLLDWIEKDPTVLPLPTTDALSAAERCRWLDARLELDLCAEQLRRRGLDDQIEPLLGGAYLQVERALGAA